MAFYLWAIAVFVAFQPGMMVLTTLLPFLIWILTVAEVHVAAGSATLNLSVTVRPAETPAGCAFVVGTNEFLKHGYTLRRATSSLWASPASRRCARCSWDRDLGIAVHHRLAEEGRLAGVKLCQAVTGREVIWPCIAPQARSR